VWASVQHTGGIEDYVILAICTVLGVLAKKYKFSRPAMLMAFILAGKVEALTMQMNSLYTIDRLIDRPLFILLMVFVVCLFVYGITRKNKLEYA
jgi:TctA family transporter